MTRIQIGGRSPDEIIRKRLEDIAREGTRPPSLPPNTLPPVPTNPSGYSIDALIAGKHFFYSDAKDSSGRFVGVSVALQDTLAYSAGGGLVLTMPEHLAIKVKEDKSTSDFWKNWFIVHTEENIGVDTKGKFYAANEPVLVVVHGGGLLTPDRIKKAYADGLVNNSARYEQDEFDQFLQGKIAGGTNIPFYHLEALQSGTLSNLPHQYGIVMPYRTAQGTASGYHNKADFLANPLVLARAGGSQYLEAYFDKAKGTGDQVGNWHPFSGRDATIPQGRVLFLSGSDYGLYGDYNLGSDGRFVGVAPEALGRAKK